MLRTVYPYAGIILILFASPTRADEPAPENRPAAPALGGLLGLGNMAQAASDAKDAALAVERIAPALEVIATSIASLSSEFDPFGYKTAFRTIGQQAEIIERQHEIIRELQQQEIDRLREELEASRKPPVGKNRKRRKAGGN